MENATANHYSIFPKKPRQLAVNKEKKSGRNLDRLPTERRDHLKYLSLYNIVHPSDIVFINLCTNDDAVISNVILSIGREFSAHKYVSVCSIPS